jgi:hypothetical protein
MPPILNGCARFLVLVVDDRMGWKLRIFDLGIVVSLHGHLGWGRRGTIGGLRRSVKSATTRNTDAESKNGGRC